MDPIHTIYKHVLTIDMFTSRLFAEASSKIPEYRPPVIETPGYDEDPGTVKNAEPDLLSSLPLSDSDSDSDTMKRPVVKNTEKMAPETRKSSESNKPLGRTDRTEFLYDDSDSSSDMNDYRTKEGGGLHAEDSMSESDSESDDHHGGVSEGYNASEIGAKRRKKDAGDCDVDEGNEERRDEEWRRRRRKAAEEESSEHVWMDELCGKAKETNMDLLDYCKMVKGNAEKYDLDHWSKARK